MKRLQAGHITRLLATYQIDVLAVAKRIRETQRGALNASLIEIGALADYVAQNEIYLDETEEEKTNGNAV